MLVYVCGIELNAIRFFSCCGSLCVFFFGALLRLFCVRFFSISIRVVFFVILLVLLQFVSFGAGAVALEYNSHTSNSAYSFRHLNLMGSNAICCLLLGFC